MFVSKVAEASSASVRGFFVARKISTIVFSTRTRDTHYSPSLIYRLQDQPEGRGLSWQQRELET